VSRPIRIDPRGEPVFVFGEMLEPSGAAPLKIDVWRQVRHPPPDLIHAYGVKTLQDRGEWFRAGHPATLVGKLVSWIWVCDELPRTTSRWRVRVDVRQGQNSAPGYPAEYSGPLPAGQSLAQLKISEIFED
jgi:hypothetical protein